MSLEALALQLLFTLAPEAIEALKAALDQGKSEEDALASARAHLPARIDTTAEDAARRARLTASARTLRSATVPPALLTPDVEAALRELLDHHDPLPDSPIAAAVRDHIERSERSEDITTEIAVPANR